MMDCFEVLGIEKAAALDEEAVRRQYHEAAKNSHPDQAENEEEREAFSKRSAELNQAWETLRHPVSRLRHLLELIDPGGKRDAGIDGSLVEIFGEVGRAVQKADAFFSKRSKASSALGKALLADEQIEVQESLQGVLGRVTAAHEERISELARVDVDSVSDLEAVYTQLTFLDKWQRQIQDRLLRILTED